MTKLTGTYYDGQSSLGHKATVDIEKYELYFEVKDSRAQFSWLEKAIEYKNLGGNVIQLTYLNEHGNQELFETTIDDPIELQKAKDALYFLQRDVTSKLLFHNLKAIIPIFIAVFGIMALAYFYAIPYGAEKIAENTALSVENELGDLISTSFSKSMKIDTIRTEKLMAFYKKLNHHSKYNIRLHVVNDDETVNAFAIPGGKIYVFSGLLKEIKKPEQLISLLYHEMGHIEHKHSLKHIYRSLSRSLILSALLNDINGISNIIIENANMLLQLKYSKELESDADKYSLESMYKEKIDINGFTGLFEILEKESGEGPPEILSTHPLNKNRIKSAESYIKKQKNVTMDKTLDSLFWRI
jgi:beta-barrel assembly-enhancing protease